MSPINALHVAKALDLMGKPEPPIAMCPRCPDEPLVFTFERRGFEFTCLSCGGWFGFLDPRAAAPTPELLVLADERKATYQLAREARRALRESPAHPEEAPRV
jgi:hypothetical protein